MTSEARSRFEPVALRHGLRQLGIGFALIALFFVSSAGSDASWHKLFDSRGLEQGLALFEGLLSPDLDRVFVQRVLQLTLESLAIGALGMALALILGVPLALLAGRAPALRDGPAISPSRSLARGSVRWFARTTLSGLRAIPEVVWAFLFVRVFGLGPGPAVFAIGLTFAGIIGKLYAELIDGCDPEPVRALEAAGNSRLSVLIHGVLPQVRTQWAGYGLFRFECALRSAAILGVVGAGGLGSEIELSIRYFEYDKLSTALLALLGCVLLLELASAYLRRQRTGARSALWLLLLSTLAAFQMLDVDWSELWTAEALVQGRAFLSGFLSPTVAGTFVSGAVWLMLQTIAMAALATVMAAVAALVAAPFASRVLTVAGFLSHGPRPRGALRALMARAVLMSTRSVLQVSRALPELVWALLFIVWVGPGPFAGALAIAAHTFGILGRLYGEVYEDAETQFAQPPRLLEAAGASRFATWAHGVWPQCAPQLATFTLFRFEVNVRATAMVGFVGAGGIGDAIHTAISLFHMSDLAMLLGILFAAVVIVDIAGDALRRRLLAP